MNGQQTILIPAAIGNSPGVYQIISPVKYFTAISHTGNYSIKYGTNTTNIVNPGDGFGTTNSATYASVTLSNYGGSAVTATVYEGLEPTQLASTTINNAITVTGTISAPVASLSEAVPGQIEVTGGTSAPVKFSSGALFVTWFSVIAQKDYSGTANAGAVRMGVSSAANSQPLPLAPGDERVFTAKAGGKIDLSKIYLAVANNGDGVTVLYFQ